MSAPSFPIRCFSWKHQPIASLQVQTSSLKVGQQLHPSSCSAPKSLHWAFFMVFNLSHGQFTLWGSDQVMALNSHGCVLCEFVLLPFPFLSSHEAKLLPRVAPPFASAPIPASKILEAKAPSPLLQHRGTFLFLLPSHIRTSEGVHNSRHGFLQCRHLYLSWAPWSWAVLGDIVLWDGGECVIPF